MIYCVKRCDRIDLRLCALSVLQQPVVDLRLLEAYSVRVRLVAWNLTLIDKIVDRLCFLASQKTYICNVEHFFRCDQRQLLNLIQTLDDFFIHISSSGFSGLTSSACARTRPATKNIIPKQTLCAVPVESPTTIETTPRMTATVNNTG